MKKGYPNHPYRVTTDLRQLVKEASKEFQDRVYLRYKSKTPDEFKEVTYAQFDDMVDALGTSFYAMGLGKKHIAVIGDTCPEWIATYLSVVNGGGVIVPLDRELSHDEIGNFLIRAEASAVVFAPRFRELFEKLSETSDISYFIEIGDGKDFINDRFISTATLIEKGTALIEDGYCDYLDYEVNVEDDAAILFTSGTTGTSKGVLLSQANIVAAINGSISMLEFSPDDTLLSVLPIHHTYEMTCGILTPLTVGCVICINDSLKYLIKNLKTFRPTVLILVPQFVTTVYKRIWDTAAKNGKDKTLKFGISLSNALKKAKIDLSKQLFSDVTAAFGGRLRKIVCGGAALSADYVKGFNEMGINLVQGYGITECAPLISVCPFNWNKYGAVGLPIPGLEVKIDRENDEDREGEIVVRGANVMRGYYKAPELTSDVIDEDGWFKTGDIGYVDEDGFIYITGRKKNIIILDNGKNVFPEELEEYIYRSPLVSECVVIGKTLESGETVICAQIFPDFAKAEEMGIGGIDNIKNTLKEYVQTLNKALPLFKQIRSVEIRKSEFDKTTTKKIKR
jgi:long-chain acyl-CoA synthetase